MTTEERLEALERELSRVKRRSRWLLVMTSLGTALVLTGPLAGEALGQLSRTTRGLPWGKRLLVEVLVFGTIGLVPVAVGVVAYLIKRITGRGTDNARQNLGTPAEHASRPPSAGTNRQERFSAECVKCGMYLREGLRWDEISDESVECTHCGQLNAHPAAQSPAKGHK